MKYNRKQTITAICAFVCVIMIIAISIRITGDRELAALLGSIVILLFAMIKLIMAGRRIRKLEEELSINTNRDKMTGLLNRRAYENDLMTCPDVPPEPNFVYAAVDINGLKMVNDTIGHAAGDELIRATAECLSRTLGNYGRVYRTGGDEFASMLFADEEHLPPLIEDLKRMTDAWKGQMVSQLSVSVGYVTKREFSEETVAEMAKIADRRMYQDKREYYSRKGFDRRGQAAAHTALCNLYTKILKINLTDDTYSIVNIDLSEQANEKGYADTISEWLRGFGLSGQVHPEDLDNYLKLTDLSYLKDYFKQDKKSISIFYRRKYSDIYKQVVMEMIPADDYTHDHQSLYLYVKSIDK